MDQSTSPPQTQKKTQACDACRLRKVKCNGASRCQQCSHLNLRCIYSAPRGRARTSTKRGALISRYKAESAASPDASSTSPSFSDVSDQRTQLSDGSKDRFYGSPNGSYAPRLPSLVEAVPLNAPTSHSLLQPDAVPYDSAYFLGFLSDYEKCVYPVNPVITANEARDAVREMSQSREACAFIYALVAVTYILTPNHDTDRPTLQYVMYWSELAVSTKVPFAPGVEASPRAIMTSEFLHITFMALQKTDVAFYYLREAITLGSVMRLEDPESLACLSPVEASRRQRLYWELFIHERYCAIACYKHTVLWPLHTYPEYDGETPRHVHDGFMQIIKLFRILDQQFIQNWIDSRSTAPRGVTLEWIEEKHRQIKNEPAGSDEMTAPLTTMQQTDLIVTKHWLHTLVWQLALSHCLLGVSDSSMSVTFPLGLSSNLRNLITRMSRKDIEVHGAGLQEKLFDITDMIANVMLAMPITTTPESVQNMEDFVFLAKFVFSLPTFGIMQRQILNEKVSALQRQFPSDSEEVNGAGRLQEFSQWLDQMAYEETGLEI